MIEYYSKVNWDYGNNSLMIWIVVMIAIIRISSFHGNILLEEESLLKELLSHWIFNGNTFQFLIRVKELGDLPLL